MPAANMEDIIKLLQSSFGARWEGSKGNGRDEMIRSLEGQTGFTRQTASESIDAAIDSGEIRFHALDEDHASRAATDLSPSSGAGIIATPATNNAAIAPTTVTSEPNGYWLIGHDTNDMGTGEKLPMLGREGQVDPTS